MQPLDPSKPPRIIFVEGPPLPELPVTMSQVIVIGRVTSITPWLTPGNKTIYSEYGVAVDSVLMNRSNWKQDTTLDVVQMGGSASLPNGGTVSVTTRGLGERIETGHTYVFFLIYVPIAESFKFVKTWDVTDGHAVPISGDDVGRARNNTSTVSGLLLQQLVARIQALVNDNK